MSLVNIKELCPRVDTASNYWLVRTQSGLLYPSFKRQNVIALTYQEVSEESLKKIKIQSSGDNRAFIRDLKTIATDKYPEKERPGLIASQINRFINEIKENDLVMIPNINSKSLSIGVVKNQEFTTSTLLNGDGEAIGDFITRNVEWLKTVRRTTVNPHLYGLFSTHQTIANANDYAEWIDPLLFDFYEKNDEYHLVVKVKTDKEIKSRILLKTLLELYDLTDSLDLDTDTNEIINTINLNSPGDVKLKSPKSKKGFATLFVIGMLIIGINGGGLKIKEIGLDLSSDGLINTVNNYLNDRNNRIIKDELRKKINELEIEDSEEINMLLNEMNNAGSD